MAQCLVEVPLFGSFTLFFLSLSLLFSLPPFPPRSLAQRPCSDCRILVTCPQLPLVVTHGGETAGGTVTLR